MSQLWKVGLFAKDYSYFDDMFEFANKLIGSKGEVVTYIERQLEHLELTQIKLHIDL